MAQTFSTVEVAKHKNEENGFWLIVENDVFDVTQFLDEHPGGSKILKRVSGKNATKQFWKYHNEHVLKRYGEKLKVGTVEEAPKL